MSTLFSHFFQKINQISPLEHSFTEVLEGIALKPKTLYFRGKLPENMVKSANPTQKSAKSTQNPTQNVNHTKTIQKSASPTQTLVNSTPEISERPKTVAIVGSRHNTRYGEEVAYKLAYTLAQRGVIIVSGLAFGIDSIGHKAAVDAGGRTIAVLGTPIDHIYPRPHEALARQIIEKDGAIISEYAPRTPEYDSAPLAPGESGQLGDKWYSGESIMLRELAAEQGGAQLSLDLPPESTRFANRKINPYSSFLYRNRLISGLADIVVVVEAAEKSGSLNTAAHALEQGKDVFAVPGNITSPYSQGCNKLLRQGAFTYTEPDDVLRLLFPDDYIKKRKAAHRRGLIGDTDMETLVLTALGGGLRSSEDIMAATKLPPEVFSQAVTILEVKGRIRALGSANWGLC